MNVKANEISRSCPFGEGKMSDKAQIHLTNINERYIITTTGVVIDTEDNNKIVIPYYDFTAGVVVIELQECTKNEILCYNYKDLCKYYLKLDHTLLESRVIHLRKYGTVKPNYYPTLRDVMEVNAQVELALLKSDK